MAIQNFEEICWCLKGMCVAWLKADLEGLIVCSKLNTRNISQPDWESPACFKTPTITKKITVLHSKRFHKFWWWTTAIRLSLKCGLLPSWVLLRWCSDKCHQDTPSCLQHPVSSPWHTESICACVSKCRHITFTIHNNLPFIATGRTSLNAEQI